ncbi:MAG: toll/interleukin-1 receptor domain-containing protein, partial [Bacteroidales bacterium]|nr:toll/interleukin-1 receptor domain-containing protein [Bacteroidales bacterium]
MDNQIFTYYAFISYKREDEKWAKWLQKKLESYGFPVALRKDNPSLPQKIRPIFRDQSDLSGGNLKEEIEKGL